MASKLGVQEFVLTDLKSELARLFIFPAIQGHVLYDVGNSLVNTIRAKAVIELAEEENIDYIAHGICNSNECMTFELSCYALNESIKIIFHHRQSLTSVLKMEIASCSTLRKKSYKYL